MRSLMTLRSWDLRCWPRPECARKRAPAAAPAPNAAAGASACARKASGAASKRHSQRGEEARKRRTGDRLQTSFRQEAGAEGEQKVRAARSF